MLLAHGANVASKLKGERVLIVLTHNLGMGVDDSVGAVRHLGAEGAVSLQDYIDFEDELSSGAADLTGETRQKYIDDVLGDHPGRLAPDGEGFFLVAKERSLRGLDLDFDAVVVVGRPVGPDEYVHISGRTGRAGKKGRVVNALSQSDTKKLKN